MSNLPLTDINVEEESGYGFSLSNIPNIDDDSWSLLYLQSPQRIINEEDDRTLNNNNRTDSRGNSAGAPVPVHQQHCYWGRILESRGLHESMEISTTPHHIHNTKKRKKNSKSTASTTTRHIPNYQQITSAEEVAKKLDHNAKERIRRMKLNASFLALRALLPHHSTTSKKRWCAPSIVDRVVKYIPDLENEVESLRSQKENILQQYSAANNKKAVIDKIPSSEYEIPRLSFNKVNQEEAIIQICMAREDYQDGLAFTHLLQSVEDEGIFLIKSASTLYICETIICCHLHIQRSDATSGADCIEQIRDKMISWLRVR